MPDLQTPAQCYYLTVVNINIIAATQLQVEKAAESHPLRDCAPLTLHNSSAHSYACLLILRVFAQQDICSLDPFFDWAVFAWQWRAKISRNIRCNFANRQ